MESMADRLTMTRLVRGRAPGREFDIAFWQALGPTRIVEAAWDLVVGGYAVMVHTEPRYTKDLDIWIDPTESNAQALMTALSQFGASTADVQLSDFTVPDVFFQIGIDPVRIDIMTSVQGLDFAGAWDRKITVDFGGALALVLFREDVITAKRSTGRARDSREGYIRAKRSYSALNSQPTRAMAASRYIHTTSAMLVPMLPYMTL